MEKIFFFFSSRRSKELVTSLTYTHTVPNKTLKMQQKNAEMWKVLRTIQTSYSLQTLSLSRSRTLL
jgi:hypothetical protein